MFNVHAIFFSTNRHGRERRSGRRDGDSGRSRTAGRFATIEPERSRSSVRSNKSGRDGVTYSRCFPHLKQPLLVCPLKKYGIFWEFCPKPLLQRGRGTEPTALRVTRPKLQQLNQNQNLCYTKNNPEITKKTT